MRIYRLVGALVIATALGLIAVATASAAETLWKWLPGSVEETFTGKSGKITLQLKGGATITCANSLILLTFGLDSSELVEEGSIAGKDAILALAILHMEGCTSAGLPINSLGDALKVILAHLEIHNCMIKKEHFGWLIKLLPLHLEIPSVKLLVIFEGSFIALLEATKQMGHFVLNINQKEGVQGITKCEGGTAETLLDEDDGEPFAQAGIEMKEALILFDLTIDNAGETMMEK